MARNPRRVIPVNYGNPQSSYVDGPYWQALFDVLNELVCFGHMSGLLVRVYDRWP